MKTAREYITAIRKGLGIWEHWINEGNTIISKHKESFPEVIRAETAIIRQLNPQDVKDAILEHEDGIGMRIKRLDEYKLPAVVQYLIDTADTTAQLSDTAISSLIDEYRKYIEYKTAQLLKVIRECENYIQANDLHKKGNGMEGEKLKLTIPNDILLLFKDEESAEDYFSWEKYTTVPRNWGTRYNEYGVSKERRSKGDFKKIFEFLRQLHPDIIDDVDKFRRAISI
jgi:hypothetical protein